MPKMTTPTMLCAMRLTIMESSATIFTFLSRHRRPKPCHFPRIMRPRSHPPRPPQIPCSAGAHDTSGSTGTSALRSRSATPTRSRRAASVPSSRGHDPSISPRRRRPARPLRPAFRVFFHCNSFFNGYMLSRRRAAETHPSHVRETGLPAPHPDHRHFQDHDLRHRPYVSRVVRYSDPCQRHDLDGVP